MSRFVLARSLQRYRRLRAKTVPRAAHLPKLHGFLTVLEDLQSPGQFPWPLTVRLIEVL